MPRKKIMRDSRRELSYGEGTGVSFAEAKHSFLSGMSKGFKKKVKIKFTK